MSKQHKTESYSPEEYRKSINFLLDRIDNVKVLHQILAIVNRIFCEN